MTDLTQSYKLITSPQTVTGVWVSLGSPFKIQEFSSIGLFLDITINDSKNLEVRFVGKKGVDESGDYLYQELENTISGKQISKSKPIQIDKDTNQKIIIPIKNIDMTLPAIQFQIRALTPGATPAQITAASYLRGYRQ